MNATIDGGGRVVIPKAVREELGLVSGAALEIEVRDGVVVLIPAPARLRLVKRGRGLVAEPVEALPTLTAAEVRAALDASRR